MESGDKLKSPLKNVDIEPSKKPHQGLYDNGNISIFQRLSPQFGVNVRILKKQGERYIYHSTDPKTNQAEYWGSVPKGKSYIALSCERQDISDFWNAVKKEPNISK